MSDINIIVLSVMVAIEMAAILIIDNDLSNKISELKDEIELLKKKVN